MIKSSCLFSNITVVTANEQAQVTALPSAWVAVRDGVISYAGPLEAKARETLKDISYESYDGRKKLLLPAMANTHGHTPMTLFRNQADDRVLQDWLFNVIFPREERLNHQTVYWGTMLGFSEMIRNGIGATAEMYYFDEASVQSALETGFRMNLCCDAKRKDADGKIQVVPELLEKDLQSYQHHPSGLLRVSLLIHSVYLYEERLYPVLADLARSLDCGVQVHVSETRKEVQDCLAKYGCRPPRQLEKFGFFQTPTIAAHCVHLDDDDREVLASHPILVAHNPSSNMKLGSGIADLAAMLKAGIKIGLGTDGAGSNNNLDLYREMRLASFLAKGSSGDAALLSASELLDMATRQGMLGLGFAGSGRIAAGYQADLQIVDCDRPALTPLGDPVSALVYSADGGSVESLMVDGCWLMRKRELMTIDSDRVLFEAGREARYLNGN